MRIRQIKFRVSASRPYPKSVAQHCVSLIKQSFDHPLLHALIREKNTIYLKSAHLKLGSISLHDLRMGNVQAFCQSLVQQLLAHVQRQPPSAIHTTPAIENHLSRDETHTVTDSSTDNTPATATQSTYQAIMQDLCALFSRGAWSHRQKPKLQTIARLLHACLERHQRADELAWLHWPSTQKRLQQILKKQVQSQPWSQLQTYLSAEKVRSTSQNKTGMPALSLTRSLQSLEQHRCELQRFAQQKLDEEHWRCQCYQFARVVDNDPHLPEPIRAALMTYLQDSLDHIQKSSQLQRLQQHIQQLFEALKREGQTQERKPNWRHVYAGGDTALKPLWFQHGQLPALLAKSLQTQTPQGSQADLKPYDMFTRPLAVTHQTFLALYAREIDILTQIQGFLEKVAPHDLWHRALRHVLRRSQTAWPPTRAKIRDCIDFCRLVKRFFDAPTNRALPGERLCLSWVRHLYPEANHTTQTPRFQVKSELFERLKTDYENLLTLDEYEKISQKHSYWIEHIDKSRFPDLYWEVKQQPKHAQTTRLRYAQAKKQQWQENQSALVNACNAASSHRLHQALEAMQGSTLAQKKRWQKSLTPTLTADPLAHVQQTSATELHAQMDRSMQRMQKELSGTPWHTQDCGLILLWPLLKQFFTQHTWWYDDAWQDGGQYRACVFLTSLLGEQQTLDTCITAKLMTGYPADTLLEECDAETHSQIKDLHASFWLWLTHSFPYMQQLKPEGLQQLLLHRGGHWQSCHFGYQLDVDANPSDVILNHLPWPISYIRLPWQDFGLQVHWSWPSLPTPMTRPLS